MFLAKPLRFRADLVCARSYAGKGAVLRSGAFLCPADPVRQVDSRIPVCDPAAGIAFPASTSARTRLASCPRKSRCVTLPCELLWRIPASESTLRSCHGSVDIVACSPVPAPVSQISLAQALDVRLTRGFVPRLTSMLRSIRGGGASRPARRVQAGLGEEREPACRLRLSRVCLHLAYPSMYGTTCPYLPFGCQPSRQCVVSMRRASRPFLTYAAPPARRGRRIHAVRELWQGNRPARTKMPLCWQDVANMRSPGARRWQDCALMRSWPDWQWQYTRAVRSRGLAATRFRRGAFPSALPWQDFTTVRSRALADGKMLAKCVPGRQSVASFALHASQKWLRTGKSPVRGSILPPCIQNELALAGYARYASEKPRKPPFGNARREDLARKDSFRCTGPSNHARRANLAIL